MLQKIVTENVVTNSPSDTLTNYDGAHGDIVFNPESNEFLTYDAGNNALNSASGLIKISSGTITAPVEYFDVALPDGFLFFKLYIANTVISVNDNICGALSIDNGATFLYDNVNFRAYSNVSVGGFVNNSANAAFGGGGFGDDTFMEFLAVDQNAAGYNGCGIIEIFPGSDHSSIMVQANTTGLSISGYVGNDLVAAINSYMPNIFAFPTYATARMNLLRILPYGNGDCNPPTSGETITSGSWVLYGVKV